MPVCMCLCVYVCVCVCVYLCEQRGKGVRGNPETLFSPIEVCHTDI